MLYIILVTASAGVARGQREIERGRYDQGEGVIGNKQTGIRLGANCGGAGGVESIL